MDNVNLELRTRISSKYSNSLTVGYNVMDDYRESKGGQPFPLVDIMNPDGSSMTAFGYEPFTAFNSLKTKVFQATNNFNIYAGKHEITLGANFENYRTKMVLHQTTMELILLPVLTIFIIQLKRRFKCDQIPDTVFGIG
ncbi:hypothetical protein KUH03_35080 [Sphingobacterium sp. E70]|uniref:hypothetical protein n=1 Tax=Sphingobacterium sp. E70 TaxID=2853439 RepID=UPI00211C910F|nr:hypothetical protein [Sphingobacterium sp. E70]ULT24202.1 hypothetical protein KUH03_35080 [Sphingobacterium sp. E70]